LTATDNSTDIFEPTTESAETETSTTAVKTGRSLRKPVLVGAAAVLFIPRQMLSLLRGFTYLVLGVGFVASLWLLTVPMSVGWHFQYIKEWIPAFGIRYHVAIDGISLWLVLLTTFVTPIAAYASFGSIKTRIKELCFAFLLLQGAMIGAFVALDLFLFYVFWELMLVPMFLMIGVWGGVDRIKAAVKFFLYTMAGSVLMLAAMVYLVWANQKLTGEFTFDFLALSRVVLAGPPPHASMWQVISSPQGLCFFAFSLAFFIKVPMWPLHTWLPDAHVQAPTGGSVILAAVMLKLGTYAYMRFSMGLFPGPASSLAANLAGVAILGGILYGALVAWKQKDVKRLGHPLRRARRVEAEGRQTPRRVLIRRALGLRHVGPLQRNADGGSRCRASNGEPRHVDRCVVPLGRRDLRPTSHA